MNDRLLNNKFQTMQNVNLNNENINNKHYTQAFS